MRPYVAQIRSTLRLMGRDRSVLFFSYLFPLVFFFLFAQAFHARSSPGAMAQVIAAVLIIGVLGNGFFGAGMRAVQDRETNVLRRFKVAPVSAAPIIVASLVSGVVSFLPSAFLFFLFARVFYHMPLPSNLAAVLVFICVAVLAFRAMGMIVAAVANSAQEANIVTQLLYLPMLFLSGATFPVQMMPVWVQTVAQFMPATYLYQGLESMVIGREGLARNAAAAAALLVTMAVALTVGTKLFRWEKEEKIAGAAKLWIVAVLAPFIAMGVYQAATKRNIERSKILARAAVRNSSLLLQNAHIFVGDGTVIEKGAVLLRGGKISEVYGTPPPNPEKLNAEIVDASGKTVMPGLIDIHVHLGAPGGVYAQTSKYANPNLAKRRLASYLYSGITAVRSTGDWLHSSLEMRNAVNSGGYLGAELIVYGPLFTAKGGHPEELLQSMPQNVRNTAMAEFLRKPGSQAEARTQVDELKRDEVDGIKAVLEAGNSHWTLFNRLDSGIYRALIEQAAKDHLPAATHTGSAADVREAVAAGTNSVEHGSAVDSIPEELFATMREKHIAYDPTLSMLEGVADLRAGNADLLANSLLQQAAPADLLEDTRAMLRKQARAADGEPKPVPEVAQRNLLSAQRQGVMLIAGSDAGNMLVIHGPTVQHELELWVRAGVPSAIALEAATWHAAQVLHAENRIGLIRKDHDATLLLLDGDPVRDISATEHINAVYFRGEHVDRPDLFSQDKP